MLDEIENVSQELFPAYAGVIHMGMLQLFQDCAFPRIRGGDPLNLTDREMVAFFSPHTRG